MFNDQEKSTFLGRFIFKYKTEYYYKKFHKKFASIKARPVVWGIWNVVVYGPNIHLGKNAIIVGADGSRTTLTTVSFNGHQGNIIIGDNVLIMNGVRISSASRVEIGDDCMLANFCYLTDSDWHGIYDRTESPGATAPITLEKGVWIGDSAIICKGVRIGENSIVGAGSVVRKDVPPNSVVIGNPAEVVKELDPSRVVTMGKIYENNRFGDRS